MKNWLFANWLYITGALVGAVAGFLYWKLEGCSTGTCAITSKPLNSTAYFSVMGALVFGFFKQNTGRAQQPDTAD